MTKPLIQIEDEVRAMTDDEYAFYLQATANTIETADETPVADA